MVPPSSAEGRPFAPIVTALTTFGDFGSDTPKGTGHFLEVAHQFQRGGVSSANAGFGLGLTTGQRAAIEEHAVLRDALRGLGRAASDG